VDASIPAAASMTSSQRIAPYAWFIMLQAFVTIDVLPGLKAEDSRDRGSTS
jgi:hypothetical protein